MLANPRISRAERQLMKSILTLDNILALVPLPDRKALAAEGIWAFELALLTRLTTERMQAIGGKVPSESSDEEIRQLLSENEARDLLLVSRIRWAFIHSAVPDWRTTRDWHVYSTRGMALWRRVDHLLLSYLRSMPRGSAPGSYARRWAA